MVIGGVALTTASEMRKHETIGGLGLQSFPVVIRMDLLEGFKTTFGRASASFLSCLRLRESRLQHPFWRSQPCEASLTSHRHQKGASPVLLVAPKTLPAPASNLDSFAGPRTRAKHTKAVTDRRSDGVRHQFPEDLEPKDVLALGVLNPVKSLR